MAVEIKKRTVFNLGSVVASRIDSFRIAREKVQLKEEEQFLQRVLSEGVSFAEQMAFREAQIEREKGRNVPDNNYLRTLRTEVSKLKQQVRQERLRNQYQDSLMDLVAGRTSLRDHKDFLEKQLQQTSDPEIESQLRQALTEIEKSIVASDRAFLDNKIELAKRDKSIELIDNAILDVQKERARALAIGDNERTSALDLKLQSLNQAKVEIQVQDTINNLTIQRTKNPTAVGYLKALADQIDSADQSTSVVINGVRYNNAREFWAQERDKYVAGKFIDELGGEYNDYMRNVNQVTGTIPEHVLQTINSDFQNIAARPELILFANQLQSLKLDVLSTAINRTAEGVLNRFGQDSNAPAALTELARLQNQYGVSLEGQMQTILAQAAETKGQVTDVFLQTVSGFQQEGMSLDQAIAETNKMISSGQLAITPISQQDLLSKTPEQIARERAEPGQTQQALQQTITQPQTQQSQTQIPSPTGKVSAPQQFGTFVRFFNEPIEGFSPETVFALDGDILRPISSMEKLQQAGFQGNLIEQGRSFFESKQLGESI